MSVPFALSSAVAYGFGDFAGGLAARMTPVLRVTAVAQVAGLLALLPAAFLVPGHISAAAVGPSFVLLTTWLVEQITKKRLVSSGRVGCAVSRSVPCR